jgi:hypothetical protein
MKVTGYITSTEWKITAFQNKFQITTQREDDSDVISKDSCMT